VVGLVTIRKRLNLFKWALINDFQVRFFFRSTHALATGYWQSSQGATGG